MPTIAHSNIPPPKSWDEFEDIILSAAKLRWSSRDFFRHGRRGQSQQGVDVYGQDAEGRHLGVQGKNTITGTTRKDVMEEIAKAESFDPPLNALYVATTAKRDANIQSVVRNISASRQRDNKFSVGILFWDDIVQDLARDEAELFKHYSQLRTGGPQDAVLSISGPHLLRDRNYKNKNQWRVTVHNAGPAAARNVQMKLRSGAEEPKDPRWSGDYPYPVSRVGTITNDPGHINVPGQQINANDDEMYEIVCGWETERGHQFFTDINTKGGGHNQIQINSNERWKLSYEVTAENASPIKFDLEIFIENDGVKAIRTCAVTSGC
jgi:hypothetical protein